jgi:pimeloyl-ACP methyl ester carboxylesterase
MKIILAVAEPLVVSAADGRRLAVAEWGAAHGVPVIWEHGTPGSRLVHPALVEAGVLDVIRDAGVRLVTYDRPGYGRSERRAGRKVVDSAADVLSIADALELDSFAVAGGSSGGTYALASAVLLRERVTRAACVAPMAPFDQLGFDEWTRDQDEAVTAWTRGCLQGEGQLVPAVEAAADEMREQASGNAYAEESLRNGIWGWVDDELAVFGPWGFDVSRASCPVAIFRDPEERVLPRQHGDWLARQISDAAVVDSGSLGHRHEGNPMPDLQRLYEWLGAAAA